MKLSAQNIGKKTIGRCRCQHAVCADETPRVFGLQADQENNRPSLIGTSLTYRRRPACLRKPGVDAFRTKIGHTLRGASCGNSEDIITEAHQLQANGRTAINRPTSFRKITIK